MFYYNSKKDIIYLNFVEIDKNSTHVYHNPTISSTKNRPKADNAKSIFEEFFRKNK